MKKVLITITSHARGTKFQIVANWRYQILVDYYWVTEQNPQPASGQSSAVLKFMK